MKHTFYDHNLQAAKEAYELLANVDYKLLRQQVHGLYQLQADIETERPVDFEWLEGVLSLLDCVEDWGNKFVNINPDAEEK